VAARVIPAHGSRGNGVAIVLERLDAGLWVHRFEIFVPASAFSAFVTAVVEAEDQAIALNWIKPPPDNSEDGEPGW
jgi:hypothetical protein